MKTLHTRAEPPLDVASFRAALSVVKDGSTATRYRLFESIVATELACTGKELPLRYANNVE